MFDARDRVGMMMHDRFTEISRFFGVADLVHGVGVFPVTRWSIRA